MESVSPTPTRRPSAAMPTICEVAEDVYSIDTEMYSIPGLTSAYLLAGSKPALVETGVRGSANTILSALRQIGYRPEDIAYIILTHVHLDHAGGAGDLLTHMPHAQVIAHKRGARHLVNPSKLSASASQATGRSDAEGQDALTPVDENRAHAAEDGEIIDLGAGHKLEIIYAPGHASHHVCIYDLKNKGLFTGEALGIMIPGEEVIIPCTPVPDFDLDLSIDTIMQLMEKDVELLLFSHFGPTRKVSETFHKALTILKHWGDITSALAEKGNIDRVPEELQAAAREELAGVAGKKEICEFYEILMTPLSAAGYIESYKRKHRKS
jgi:glyoxylase-like metal-dependent hydrolase (beta-lactamase superfamily II)